MKKVKSGFSAVEVLVAILIVGLLITIGWLVYNAQQTKTTTNEQTNQTTTEPAKDKSLKFAKWNIELPLEDSTEYTTQFGSDEAEEYYTIHTEKLSQICNDPTAYVATVARARWTDNYPTLNPPQTYKELYPEAEGGTEFFKYKVIGDYIYLFTSPQALCTGADESMGQEVNTIVSDFIALSSKLKASE